METQFASGLTRWTAPECPFAIDYSARVLDDIRLAVTDAFFSLPRGGAEIGGILLGRRENGRVAIVDHLPMQCEHAFGPSFVLSPKDHAGLAELLATADRNPHLRVVGWYHSHTRSEIFLSDADLEIHNRFFPQPWQVAIVLKPHTFQPMRAGFFFREADGSIHAAAPYSEVILDPLPMRPVPVSNGIPEPPSVFSSTRDAAPNGPVVDVSTVVEPETPSAPERAPEPEITPEIAPPSFATAPPPPSRRWLAWTAAALLGVALGGWGYQTRAEWLPRLRSFSQGGASENIGLAAIDREGQLHIQWNGNSRAALASISGSLLIIDGDAQLTVELGRPHVLTGSFTYARKTPRVDVTLSLPQPGGKEVREATLFIGGEMAAPAAPAAAVPAETQTNADELRAEIARLRVDNAVQVERNRRLEKALEELRKVVQREEQRKRLDAQNPDPSK